MTATNKTPRIMTFDRKLFFSIGILFVVFVVIVLVFESRLERDYRQQHINNLLQNYNTWIYKQVGAKGVEQAPIDSIIQDITPEFLRITIISAETGEVLVESHQGIENATFNNHLDRPEIKDALSQGEGQAIRYSDTLKKQYFYSAKKFGNYIIRSSRPFDPGELSILNFNNKFLYFMLGISLLAILLLYYFCRSLGRSIAALNLLSQRAEQGEPVSSLPPMGWSNEIGNITQNLTHIYSRLLRTQKKLSIEQEKLFKHLQFSKEGLAFFSKEKQLVMANNLFVQYLNFITDNSLSPHKYLFNEPPLKKINDFIAQRLYEVNNKEEFISESLILDKGSRTFLIECIIFQDHTFEIAINDITQQEQESRLKRQLTQNISHELKTPVSSIRGYMETILTTEMDEKRKHMFLERCYAQSKRLTDLLCDISMLNRLDESKDLYDTDQTDLQKIIDEVINESQSALEEKQMSIKTLQIESPMPLRGNYGLLYSIFRNLTDNAIAYAGIGTQITIDCYHKDSNYYYFSFSDNGIGVPEEHLNRLFERFYRVDKGRSRKAGGTGLGLAIVKNAVLFHKGEISAKNGVCGGLNFLFSLRKN